MGPGNLIHFAKEILEKLETVVIVVQDLLEDQETAQLRHLRVFTSNYSIKDSIRLIMHQSGKSVTFFKKILMERN